MVIVVDFMEIEVLFVVVGFKEELVNSDIVFVYGVVGDFLLRVVCLDFNDILFIIFFFSVDKFVCSKFIFVFLMFF